MINFLGSNQTGFQPNRVPTYDRFLREAIRSYDTQVAKLDTHIKKEIDSLLAQNAWNIVCQDEVPYKKNNLTGQFVLPIENEEAYRGE